MILYWGAALPAGPRGARGREKEEEREERKESPQEKEAALGEAASDVATEEDFREPEGSRRRRLWIESLQLPKGSSTDRLSSKRSDWTDS